MCSEVEYDTDDLEKYLFCGTHYSEQHLNFEELGAESLSNGEKAWNKNIVVLGLLFYVG